MKKRLLLISLITLLITAVGCGEEISDEVHNESSDVSCEESETVSTEEVAEETEPVLDEPDEPDVQEIEELTFEELSKRRFEFCSGAGGWAENFTIEADGSFTGEFHDSDMGSRTYYYSAYSGHFTNLTKIDDYTYQMTLEDIAYEDMVGTEEIVDEDLYVYTGSYCLGETDTFTIYLPGTPLDSLSEEIRSWIYYANDNETQLTMVVIADETNGYGIYSYDRPEFTIKETLEIPEEQNGLLGMTAEEDKAIPSDVMVAQVSPEEVLKGEWITYFRYRTDGWVFEWLKSDYTDEEKRLWEDGVLVISKEDNPEEIQIIHVEAEGGYGVGVGVEHTFVYQDVNFDKVPDLLICNGHHGAQGFITYYCFLQTEDGFVESPTFTEIANPAIDAENELILSQWRNMAVSHSWAEYAYRNGEYVMLRELMEDVLRDEDGEIVDPDDTVWVWFVNGEMLARSDELTDDEIYNLIYGEDSDWGIACDRWRTLYNQGLTVDYSIYSTPD